MSSLPGAHRRGASVPLRWVVLPIGAVLALALLALPGSAFEAWWVQTHQETQLWSGPDSRAVSFGRVLPWSYFQVVAPQQGPRLYVLNPLTRGYAYIDASAVGPSSPPPAVPAPGSSAAPAPGSSAAPAPGGSAGASASPVTTLPARAAPALPPDYEPWWVANFEETELWDGLGPNAVSLGPVPQMRRFMVVDQQVGSRLPVWSPEKEIRGYLDVAVAGPADPSAWMRPHTVRATQKVNLPGRSLGNTSYVRNLPLRDDETEMRKTPNNTPLDIRDRVVAGDGSEWYTVGDGGYIRAVEVRLPRPVERTLPGRWIDADLTEPAMVTLYEGDRAIRSALTIKGTQAFATPTGTFQILRRVEREIMDSETLATPIPRDAEGGYYLKDVLYTQYFTWDGASLHYNYWLGTFGYPGSHGCLGLNLDDAKFLWDWANIGTPVVIR